MTHLTLYGKRSFLLGLIVFFSLTCLFSYPLNAGQLKSEGGENKMMRTGSSGDLTTYEKKTLFIFPLLHSKRVDTGLLREYRRQYLTKLLHYMFVTDFKRIDFYGVKADESIDSFLQDAHAYIRRNVKKITAHRMQPDGKFKEAMVTGDDLIKTTEHSYALVPVIDSIERKVTSGKKSNNYSYNIYLHINVYSTKEKQKLETIKVNNKRNLIGILSSGTGGLLLDHSDLKSLSVNKRKDEKSFRNAMAGLFGIVKTKLKQMPQFLIMNTLTRVGGGKFGFDMGNDTGIKIDHRYKTFVARENGTRKMTGFGKIRKIETSYSEAQTLIGRPQEGDQLIEDPKIGINIVGGFGMAPLSINFGNDVVTGVHPCIYLGAEYELGPRLGWSEFYTAIDLRIGLPKSETLYEEYTVSQLLLNFGVLKKFYFKRFALNLGGFLGYHSAKVKSSLEEITGSGFGFTMKALLEVMITPAVSIYGGLNLDVYPNPSTVDVDGSEEPLPSFAKWNANGMSLNFGTKFTF